MNNKDVFSKNPFKIIISLISCILWGSAFPVLKISYEELNIAQNDMNSKIVLAGTRFLMASLLIFTYFILFMKQSIRLGKKDMLKLLLLGSFQTTLYYGLFYIGVSNTTGMKAAILGALETFFLIIIAHMVYEDDKINSTKIIGLLTGFLGVIFVNWGKSLSFQFNFKGEGFLIMASLLGAVCSIFVKNLSQRIHPFLVTAWQMFLGALLMLLFGLPNLKAGAMVFTPKAWILLIYSAFLSAIAFSLWFTLLKYNKAGEISLYRFTIPVSGALLSAIFVPEENITLYIIVALILVSTGLIVVNRKQS